MKHLTAQQLAERLDLDSDFDLFKGMIEDYQSGNVIAARANFKILRLDNQLQFLNYCVEYDAMYAYNFFHSLI